MRTTLRFCLTSMAAVAFFACSKNKTSSIVEGDWDYQYKAGGIYFHRYDSARPGYRIQLTLTAAMKYRYYRNDTLLQTGTYHLSNISTQGDGTQTIGKIHFSPVIKNHFQEHSTFSRHSTMLSIGDGAMDGEGSIFERK